MAWAPYIEVPQYMDYVTTNDEARHYASTLI